MTSLPTTVSIIPRIRPQSLASILKYEVLEECQLFVVLKRARTIGHSSSVCPDWASFESSCATNFLTNVVKDNYYLLGYLETPHFLSKNWCVCIFWGNFRKLLGYFMIQNLVTLPVGRVLDRDVGRAVGVGESAIARVTRDSEPVFVFLLHRRRVLF